MLEEEKKVDMDSVLMAFLLTSHNTFSPRILRFLFVCLFWFGFIFEEQSCYMISLYSPAWPGTHRNSPASSLPSKVGIAVYATMPGFCDTLKNTLMSINSYPFPGDLEQQLKFLSSLLTSEKEGK